MCFFQDEKNKPRKIVLGVPEVSTRHSGTNIAAEVLEIIDSYGIKNKIGYFTLDNAENNDSAMAVIGGELGFDGRKRRGRCFGHILNLSAKALLFGSNPEAFENQLSGAAALSETEHDLWRRRGPVRKLHNLVVDIDRSDVLSYLLRGVQQADMDQSIDPRVRARKPLNIVVDNDTRWLSQLYMIRRAIKLRPYLDVMILKHKQAWEQGNRSKRTGLMRRSAVQPRICLSENQLSDKDWDVLEHLATILGFYEVTVKTLEGDGIQRKRKRGWVGSYGNIWDVIQGFEFLMAKLEEYKAFAADYPDPEHFRININLGWQKLNKYYTILDETPIYYVALALHPAYRWGWFEEHWGKHPDWIATAKEMVQEVWETEYRNLEVVLSPGNEPVAKRRRKYQNAFEEYCEQSRYEPSSRLSTPTTTPARMRSSATPESPRDEYEAWQQSWVPTDTDIRDPIAYWQDNRAQYPRLSRMALDFLTIQPMSAECDRLFSAAGRLVTPLRSRLEVDIIGMCLVLRSWMQAKIIDDLDPLFVPTQIKVESSARSEVGARESMASFLGRARELAEEEKGPYQTIPITEYIIYYNLFQSLEDSGLFGADPELQINNTNSRALEQYYGLLAQVVRIFGATLVSRGRKNVVKGRKLLKEHRMLVAHTLKRNAGVGSGNADEGLNQKIEELAEGLIVIITTTLFLEIKFAQSSRYTTKQLTNSQFENEVFPELKQQSHGPFH
ncbi:hypothetical protein FOMA001_g19163 [Fusarium oxysporum f. sp. matthiolae]|nr:hypothetical protein FOMA001_g19163 [Fusarium oxysporum f. sp. matthiolae]